MSVEDMSIAFRMLLVMAGVAIVLGLLLNTNFYGMGGSEKVDEAEKDLQDNLCGARSPVGYMCNLKFGHEGNHSIQFEGESFLYWSGDWDGRKQRPVS